MQINIDDKVVKFLSLAGWDIKFDHSSKVLITDWAEEVILSFTTPTITWRAFISSLYSFVQKNKWFVLDLGESIGYKALDMLMEEGILIDRSKLSFEVKKVD